MKIDFKKPIKLFEDNQSTIKLLNNFENNACCKQISITENFTVDYIKKNIIPLEYLCSEFLLADVFTKGLSPVKFSKFRNLLNILISFI